MIFNTIQELKAKAGGQVNVKVSLDYLTPAYQQARDKHLQRYLGDTFLDHLEAKAKTGVDPAPTEEEVAMIGHVSSALALLTLYEWSFTSSVQHGSEGMVRIESETVKGAYKYQLAEYRAWSLAAGLSALDNALRYCQANADDFPTWNDSEAAEYHRAVLIRDARTMGSVHNLVTDRNAYEALRPMMLDLQGFLFADLIGQPQLDRILASIESPSDVVETKALEDKLRKLMSRALAAFAVSEGLRRNVIYLEGGRILQREALEPQSVEKTSNPALSTLNLTMQQNQEFAERLLSELRNFLRTNAEALPLYTEWLELNQPDPEEPYPLTVGRRKGGKVVGL